MSDEMRRGEKHTFEIVQLNEKISEAPVRQVLCSDITSERIDFARRLLCLGHVNGLDLARFALRHNVLDGVGVSKLLGQ